MSNKSLFSQRLRLALERNGLKVSPTLLAFEFNTLWRGDRITVNTARKWLLGLSVPTLDKIQVLSMLLNVPIDWLQWGGAIDSDEDQNSMAKRRIISKLNQLSDVDLHVVEAVTKALFEARQLPASKQNIEHNKKGPTASSKSLIYLEARAGVEPTYTDLQSGA